MLLFDLLSGNIELTDEEERLLDRIWDDIRRENEALGAAAEPQPKAKARRRRRAEEVTRMDHVVLRIGDLKGAYGTVEATPRGELRYHAATPEERDALADLVEEYRQLADHRDGVRFRYLPPDEFLRRLLHKFNGYTPYALWAEIVEDEQHPEPADGAH
jgi:hypothetical protein